MKKVILLMFVLSNLIFTYAQKKLTSFTSKNYSSGNVFNVDSMSLSYSTWQGGDNPNQYKMEFLKEEAGGYQYVLEKEERARYSNLTFYNGSIFPGPIYPLTNLANSNKTYDNQFRLIKDSINTPSGSIFRRLYSYDSNGNLIEKKTEAYQTGNWVNDARTIYEYDNLNRKTSERQEQYSTSTNSYDLIQIDSFVYEASTNLISSYKMFDETNQLTFEIQTDFLSGLPIQSRQYDYGYWYIQSEYFYTANRLDSIRFFEVTDDTVDINPYESIIYNYNSSNQLINKQLVEYSSGSLYTDEMEYDSDGFLTKITFSFGQSPIINQTIEYTYENVAEIDQNADLEISIYPVPVNNILTIESINEISEIVIINSLGQLVKSIYPKNEKIEIDFTSFPRGEYLLKIQSSDKLSTKKIIF